MGKLGVLTDTLQGSTDVKQAAQRYDELLLAKRDASVWDDQRQSATYKRTSSATLSTRAFIGVALREKALRSLPLFSRSAMKNSDAVHRVMFRNRLGWVD
jgi:hypothetical protein